MGTKLDHVVFNSIYYSLTLGKGVLFSVGVTGLIAVTVYVKPTISWRTEI